MKQQHQLCAKLTTAFLFIMGICTQLFFPLAHAAPRAQHTTVDFVTNTSSFNVGDVLTVTAKVHDVKNLFAYGIELNYDPKALHYKSATEQGFLNGNGSASTS